MVESSNKKYSVVDAIKIVIYNWNRASIMQGAAEMAYYMLLSLVPILLVVANVIPLLPFDTAEILNLLEQTFPEDINQIIMPIVLDYLKSGSGGAISIGLLASIWSASKVFTTLRRVLDEVYGTTEAKNFIVARLLSLLSIRRTNSWFYSGISSNRVPVNSATLTNTLDRFTTHPICIWFNYL